MRTISGCVAFRNNKVFSIPEPWAIVLKTLEQRIPTSEGRREGQAAAPASHRESSDLEERAAEPNQYRQRIEKLEVGCARTTKFWPS